MLFSNYQHCLTHGIAHQIISLCIAELMVDVACMR